MQTLSWCSLKRDCLTFKNSVKVWPLTLKLWTGEASQDHWGSKQDLRKLKVITSSQPQTSYCWCFFNASFYSANQAKCHVVILITGSDLDQNTRPFKPSWGTNSLTSLLVLFIHGGLWIVVRFLSSTVLPNHPVSLPASFQLGTLGSLQPVSTLIAHWYRLWLSVLTG